MMDRVHVILDGLPDDRAAFVEALENEEVGMYLDARSDNDTQLALSSTNGNIMKALLEAAKVVSREHKGWTTMPAGHVAALCIVIVEHGPGKLHSWTIGPDNLRREVANLTSKVPAA